MFSLCSSPVAPRTGPRAGLGVAAQCLLEHSWEQEPDRTRARVMALQFWILTPLVGTYTHQAQDFSNSDTEAGHLVAEGTLGTWGQPFIFAPINLAKSS